MVHVHLLGQIRCGFIKVGIIRADKGVHLLGQRKMDLLGQGEICILL